MPVSIARSCPAPAAYAHESLTDNPRRNAQGNRSHRIESLLLHKLHNFGGRKFLLPDKLTAREREALAAKKKKGKKSKGQGEEAEGGGDAAGAEGGPEQAESEAGSEDEAAPAKGGKGARRKPAYAGGYVLEPKKGLYDKYVLLLDFNSLYPSIIQEFNICFTTVERPKRGALAALPAATGEMAPLPAVIQELVKRRRRVKSLLKTERDPVTRHQLDVKQLALKITGERLCWLEIVPSSARSLSHVTFSSTHSLNTSEDQFLSPYSVPPYALTRSH